MALNLIDDLNILEKKRKIEYQKVGIEDVPEDLRDLVADEQEKDVQYDVSKPPTGKLGLIDDTEVKDKPTGKLGLTDDLEEKTPQEQMDLSDAPSHGYKGQAIIDKEGYWGLVKAIPEMWKDMHKAYYRADDPEADMEAPMTGEEIASSIPLVSEFIGLADAAIPALSGVAGFMISFPAAGANIIEQMVREEGLGGLVVGNLKNIDPKEIQVHRHAVMEAFGVEPNTPAGVKYLNGIAMPFQLYDEQVIGRLADWSADMWGDTPEEKENIKAWIHLGGDAALLFIPKLAKEVKTKTKGAYDKF